MIVFTCKLLRLIAVFWSQVFCFFVIWFILRKFFVLMYDDRFNKSVQKAFRNIFLKVTWVLYKICLHQFIHIQALEASVTDQCKLEGVKTSFSFKRSMGKIVMTKFNKSCCKKFLALLERSPTLIFHSANFVQSEIASLTWGATCTFRLRWCYFPRGAY